MTLHVESNDINYMMIFSIFVKQDYFQAWEDTHVIIYPTTLCGIWMLSTDNETSLVCTIKKVYLDLPLAASISRKSFSQSTPRSRSVTENRR